MGASKGMSPLARQSTCHISFRAYQCAYAAALIWAFDRSNILAALKASGGKVFGEDGAAELLAIEPTTRASRI